MNSKFNMYRIELKRLGMVFINYYSQTSDNYFSVLCHCSDHY